jgi:hypothetical protein
MDFAKKQKAEIRLLENGWTDLDKILYLKSSEEKNNLSEIIYFHLVCPLLEILLTYEGGRADKSLAV